MRRKISANSSLNLIIANIIYIINLEIYLYESRPSLLIQYFDYFLIYRYISSFPYQEKKDNSLIFSY